MQLTMTPGQVRWWRNLPESKRKAIRAARRERELRKRERARAYREERRLQIARLRAEQKLADAVYRKDLARDLAAMRRRADSHPHVASFLALDELYRACVSKLLRLSKNAPLPAGLTYRGVRVFIALSNFGRVRVLHGDSRRELFSVWPSAIW